MSDEPYFSILALSLGNFNKNVRRVEKQAEKSD